MRGLICMFFVYISTVFLLGAYLIVKGLQRSDEVINCFSWANDSLLQPYKDNAYLTDDLHLSLSDCWKALERGIFIGWLREPTTPNSLWGEIDIDDYKNFSHQKRGNFQIVVPGKYLAFAGPRDLHGQKYREDSKGRRKFSPSYYVKIFLRLGVTDVIRLNEEPYDDSPFTAAGINCHHLVFPDGTVPDRDIVRAFTRVSDAALGLVAVHCRAGLGRTGTLLALALMRSWGFSSREAVGWLRIMRPGSVLCVQRRFLADVDRDLRQRVEELHFPRLCNSLLPDSGGPASPQRWRCSVETNGEKEREGEQAST